MKKLLAILMLGLFVAGCSAHTRDVSTLGGCAAGGLAGSKIGSGDGKKVAIVVGTLLGCKAGSELGKKIESNRKVNND